MPKLKSNRGAAKRLKTTGTGRIKHYKAFGSHLLTHKTTKRKRNLRGSEILNKQDTKNMKSSFPTYEKERRPNPKWKTRGIRVEGWGEGSAIVKE